MIDRIEYKLQAESQDSDGVVPAMDSWWIYYTDTDKSPELVFKDPGTAAVYNERLRYLKRRDDGVNAYLNIMAEFRVNNAPRSVNINLENELQTVRDELINGQWITGLEKLEETIPSGDFTQALYDKFHLSFTTYIANPDNY